MNSNDKTQQIDLAKPDEAQKILPRASIVGSDRFEWNGIRVNYYRQPASEFPAELSTSEHLVVTFLNNSSHWSEQKIDGKNINFFCNTGEVTIVPATANYWARWDREIEYIVTIVSPGILQRICQESLRGDCVDIVPLVGIEDPLIHQLCLALKNEAETENSIGRIYGESIGTALAAQLLKKHTTSMNLTYSEKSYKDPRLKQAIEYIQANLNQNLSLSDIADVLNVGEFHLIRLFKQSEGITPYQYIIQQRVERAKQLLKKLDLPLTEVALQCGFSNQSHFTRHFRQATGITPKAYRDL